ncbi:hypothetical protein FJT64_022438 [Amphibalanus amphitrite]|uniref:RNase H type-1 domain-containing protein n=1 Tax=Amphibalanus amphitrite TaxID=1232801 RepID=A0A6A4WVA7_AMPAM|nr:hypothetical protein FJT64_022438 [Amphibalanus amphitrite]
MSDGPTLRPEEDAVCVVDVSNEGAGGLWWSRAAGRCQYFHRALPAAHYGATSRDSCRVELLNLVAAARLWAADWAGKSVLLRCDHPCVRRGGSPARVQMEAALDELSRQHGFTYRLEWSIQREDPLMAVADMLSRVDKPRRTVPLESGVSALAAELGAEVQLEQQSGPDDHMYDLSQCAAGP